MQELESIVIGHNGVGYGAGVFLERVIQNYFECVYYFSFNQQIVIKEESNQYVFYSNRWFDDHEDDRLIERELKLFCKENLCHIVTLFLMLIYEIKYPTGIDDGSLDIKPADENTKTRKYDNFFLYLTH